MLIVSQLIMLNLKYLFIYDANMDILIHNSLCTSQLFLPGEGEAVEWLIQRVEAVLELLV